MKKIILFFAVLAFSINVSAEVFVSPSVSSDIVIKDVVVNAGKYEVIPLDKSGGTNAVYKITVNTGNEVFRDITAFVVDEENLISFQQGYRYKGSGYHKAQTPFIINVAFTTNTNRYLVLDNSYAAIIKKKVRVSIERKFELTPELQEGIKKVFNEFYGGIKASFVAPEFNVKVESCGRANASSDASKSGDISFCFELIDQLLKTGKQDAILPVFLHEAGHSLLGLWGIPGYNNEDIADEFATYILMAGGPNGYKHLRASLDFWREKDSFSEAAYILQKGDRHSLSVQRMRNIEENMMLGEAFIRRWNKLLYQNFTDSALEGLIAKPHAGADIELAKQILEQRKILNKSS